MDDEPVDGDRALLERLNALRQSNVSFAESKSVSRFSYSVNALELQLLTRKTVFNPVALRMMQTFPMTSTMCRLTSLPASKSFTQLNGCLRPSDQPPALHLNTKPTMMR